MSEVTRASRSSPQDLTDWCLEALRGSNDVLPMRNVDLSKLTVVVPSKCRQDYLLRQIRYWSATSAQLIIVDGTSLPISSEVRHEVNTHPRIEYHHIPSSLNDRLHFAGGMIETPYAVMLSDDEFHLPTGLAASIRVLEGNPERIQREEFAAGQAAGCRNGKLRPRNLLRRSPHTYLGKFLGVGREVQFWSGHGDPAGDGGLFIGPIRYDCQCPVA